MGLSFDLSVEELPDQILDKAWMVHAWQDGAGVPIGYGARADTQQLLMAPDYGYGFCCSLGRIDAPRFWL